MERRNLIITCAGIFIPTILPCLHFSMIYRWWTSYKRKVNKELCSCDCWDTVFKGTYQETEAPGYKHVYLNATWQSSLIWFITVVFVIFLYELTKYLLILAHERKLSFLMLSVFATSMYPHYYTWWSYVNALNDDFYEQFIHQAVFSFTEALSSFLVLRMCNTSKPIELRHLFVIIVIATLHIAASAFDQFVNNVLWKKGDWHQFARDVGFMISDVFTLVVANFKISKLYPDMKLSAVLRTLTFDEVMVAIFVVLVFGFFIFYS